MSNNTFNGFSKETIKFYVNLSKNNDKAWFEKHRDEFDEFVLEPARVFVHDMGVRLKKLSPGIQADPRIDKSIFRIYRDIRFSKDKSPFKTNLGIFFWEGNGPKMERQGFYLHIEPRGIMIACGKHTFPKHVLAAYRESVVHPDHGKRLDGLIKKITKDNSYTVGGEHYKKVPRGFDPSHKNAGYLRHSGLYLLYNAPVPPEFFTPKFLEFCFKRWSEMFPVYQWLKEISENAKA